MCCEELDVDWYLPSDEEVVQRVFRCVQWTVVVYVGGSHFVGRGDEVVPWILTYERTMFAVVFDSRRGNE